MSRILIVLAGCLILFLSLELFVRLNLFHLVSYSSSESIDAQITERNKSADWNILFVGDSETRWGINPLEIDRELQLRGHQGKSFNHAFDGFGASWWPRILPALLEERSLDKVQVVVLGIQLISSHKVINDEEDCGALQRPVINSPFGKDLELNFLCSSDVGWDTKLAQEIFYHFKVFRYSSELRGLLLPDFMKISGQGQLRFNSSKSGPPINGFVPHQSISEDTDKYIDEFMRWKAQYIPERDFQPMDENIWLDLVSTEGFFDQLNSSVQSTGRKLILFALPTNPTLIDTWNRRADYIKNSKYLMKWADNNNVIYLDLGIQEVSNPSEYFSDMRHLSGEGAKLFSKSLAQELSIRLNLRNAL